jgi:endonuclease III
VLAQKVILTKSNRGVLGKCNANILEVASALTAKYRDFAHNNKTNPLNELLFIICSVKTTGESYERTYRHFRQQYRRFTDIARATESDLARALSTGGLQNIKAHQILEVINVLVREFGTPTLSPLKKWTDEECECLLTSLPGIGKKVARCIMLYSLGRQVFPVDTHCWRICQRLDWVRSTSRSGACTSKDMDRLQSKIPPQLRFSLHVNMVSLGREVCTYYEPKCSMCPIEDFCKKRGVSTVKARKLRKAHVLAE